MNVVAIVQARMGSTRFPNKVMQQIDGVPLIGRVLERLQGAKRLTKTILATSDSDVEWPLVEYVRTLGYSTFRGNETDVLDRFYCAASLERADVVVRITGDCPLIDPQLVDDVVELLLSSDVDYASNVNPPTFPDGLDVEAFTFPALERAWQRETDTFSREHVTVAMRSGSDFARSNLANELDLSALRWTVDEVEDIQVIESVYRHFSPRHDFSWRDVVQFVYSNPESFSGNSHHIGFYDRHMRGKDINSMTTAHELIGGAKAQGDQCSMGSGQQLWKRAKQVIPGGSMLLSKRAEMFLPENWPAYFSRAKGCTVWDLDGKEFTDMSIMGIGTNILGYGNEEVDEAVIRTVQAGNMSTLNCPEEVLLAEKLVELHPWADMVRLARSGGEANAIAIRIARAATGKDKVAVCGYHGWHDWYLSANLGDDENLSGHLLPGLDPKGVPKNLQGTVFPFNYNNFAELEALVTAHDIGTIKMEVCRNMGPEDDFLQKVRRLATAKGIVLIFDECTSGFRETFGGLHKKYGVEPDLAMFGKALGNGYAITATIGRREIMEAAQSTFISSTFWTERIGPTAALATLRVMERTGSWQTITATGNKIRQRWQQLAERCDLKISHWGLPALTGFSFESVDALAYKTLISQEMLKKGFLAANSVYVCTEHTDEIIDQYFESLAPIFTLVRECEDGRDVMTLLDGPVCHGGFKRLN